MRLQNSPEDVFPGRASGILTQSNMGNTFSFSMLNHSPLRFVSGRILWKAFSTASMSSTRTEPTMEIFTWALPPKFFARSAKFCVLPTLQ